MKPDLIQRRDLCRLMMAMNSIEAAYDAIKLSISLGIDTEDPLFTPLQEAAIVSYGRAFVEMRPLDRIPPKWQKFGDPKRQTIHDFLYNHRMSQIAHAQFKLSGVLVNPPGALRTDGNYQSMRGFGFEIASHWLSPMDIRQTGPHLEALSKEMNAAIALKLVELFGNKQLTEPFELISASELEKLNKARHSKSGSKKPPEPPGSKQKRT